MSENGAVPCQICGRRLPRDEVMPGSMVRDAVAATIRRAHPGWSAEGFICLDDLNRFRTVHVEDVLAEEKGALTALEADVLRSLREHEILSRNLNAEYDRGLTFGQRAADAIAEFGGSWIFIGAFFGALAGWITINSGLILARPYDPYPYILLNLVLSCLAAVQAPIIMMSQNRQEAKDRLRAEHDYRVNLKAELEVRNLNAKMDLLLAHQWQRLLEIQQIHMEMMEELLPHRRAGEGA